MPTMYSPPSPVRLTKPKVSSTLNLSASPLTGRGASLLLARLLSTERGPGDSGQCTSEAVVQFPHSAVVEVVTMRSTGSLCLLMGVLLIAVILQSQNVNVKHPEEFQVQ